MSDCGCEAPEVTTAQERRVLRITLVLNGAMAVIGGLLILWLGVPYPDYVIGTLIGLYVIKEAVEILRDARSEANNRAEEPNEHHAHE